MFRKYLYLSSLLLLILSSCEKINIGESFIRKVGDKVRIESNFSFSISSVNDYRCPRDLICVWSGDVDISLRFHQGLSNTDKVLSLYTNGKNPIEVNGYTIKLLSVDPLPISDKTTPQEDFRITMMVVKN
jgi:hypothetical protein